MRMLDETLDVGRYERRRFRRWDQRLVERREAALLADFLRRACRRGDRILDVPCGYGRFTGLLGGAARRVVAADIRPSMVGQARERCRESDDRVRFCVVDIERLPFPEGSFDGVVVLRLLQHFTGSEARLAVLSEIARVASRWAVVSAYAGAPLHRLARRLRGRSRKSLPGRRFETELRAAGLEVLRRRRALPGLHAQTLYLLAAGPGAPGCAPSPGSACGGDSSPRKLRRGRPRRRSTTGSRSPFDEGG